MTSLFFISGLILLLQAIGGKDCVMHVGGSSTQTFSLLFPCHTSTILTLRHAGIQFVAHLLVEALQLQARVRRGVDLPGEGVVLQREHLEQREVGVTAERQAEDGRGVAVVGGGHVGQDVGGVGLAVGGAAVRQEEDHGLVEAAAGG